jgi:hypothetical protein
MGWIGTPDVNLAQVATSVRRLGSPRVWRARLPPSGLTIGSTSIVVGMDWTSAR